MKDNIIGEIMKEAYIKDGKKFENFVRAEFAKGSVTMAQNSTRIDGIVKALKYVVLPMFLLIISFLIGSSLP